MEFWFSEFHTPDVKHSIRVNKQLYSKQSDYQRIDIFETPEFGRVLTLDGNCRLRRSRTTGRRSNIFNTILITIRSHIPKVTTCDNLLSKTRHRHTGPFSVPPASDSLF